MTATASLLATELVLEVLKPVSLPKMSRRANTVDAMLLTAWGLGYLAGKTALMPHPLRTLTTPMEARADGGTLEADLLVPQDAAPTFEAKGSALRWSVEITAGPGWSEIYSIIVRAPSGLVGGAGPFR